MHERPKRNLAVWIIAQLVLLCGLQVVFILIAHAIWRVILPVRWWGIATLGSTPAAITAGVVCALAIGRRLR
jgi:hypothetical protein